MAYLSEQDQDTLMFSLHGVATLFALGNGTSKEVVTYHAPTVLPVCHSHVIGAATIRGTSMPVIDLSSAIYGAEVPVVEHDRQTLIVVDCMRMQVALMVDKVKSIVSCDRKAANLLPEMVFKETCVQDATSSDERLVQLLDIERVMNEIFPAKIDEAGVLLSQEEIRLLQNLNVQVVDD